MQTTQIWISTRYNETHNIETTLPQIIFKPKDRSNIDSHNQQQSMPQHPRNTGMFLDPKTIITMIPKLYPMKITIILNTSNIFQTQALPEQPTYTLH